MAERRTVPTRPIARIRERERARQERQGRAAVRLRIASLMALSGLPSALSETQIEGYWEDLGEVGRARFLSEGWSLPEPRLHSAASAGIFGEFVASTWLLTGKKCAFCGKQGGQ
jgi:hypothetical protein